MLIMASNMTGFIQEHIELIKPLILSKVSGDDAEDIIQDTRISLWQAASQYRGEAKFSTLAHTIARRRVADYFRGKYRERKRVRKLIENTDEKNPILQSDIHWLSPAEIEVFMALGRGLTNCEIAKTLNKSSHTIRGQLKKIYQKLGCRNRMKLAILANQIYYRSKDES